MNILHVLQQSDETVLLRTRSDDAGHGEHVVLTLWLQLHIPHEILDADSIQDAIRIDEEDEKIITLLDMGLVEFVDEPVRRLLAVALASVRKP